MPGHLTAAHTVVQGKMDRLEAEELIKRYLENALSQFDFKGASLKPEKESKTPTPEPEQRKSKEKRTKKAREPSSSSEQAESSISEPTPVKVKAKKIAAKKEKRQSR